MQAGFTHRVIWDPKPLGAKRWRTVRRGRAAAVCDEMSWVHVTMVNQNSCELEKVLCGTVVTCEAELWTHTSRVKKHRWTVPIRKRFVVIMMFCIGAIRNGLFCAIMWTFCCYELWCAFEPLTPLCGSAVFVAVHRQVLCELYMLLSLDGGAFTGPCQSL